MRKPASAKPRKLSESLYRRLNVYATAAGAACAGVLSAAQPAAAQVVYKPLHVIINPSMSYWLDLAGALGYGFRFVNNHGRFAVEALGGGTGCSSDFYRNGVEVSDVGVSGGYLPLALNRGAEIGSSQFFWPSHRDFQSVFELMAGTVTGPKGNFLNVRNRYLGFKFYNPCFAESYGWARFTVHVDPDNREIQVLLSGAAYESKPQTPIRAGQTSGTADDPLFAPEPEDSVDTPGVRSEPEPISQATPQAPLGLLALGVQALPFWRREAVRPSLPGR